VRKSPVSKSKPEQIPATTQKLCHNDRHRPSNVYETKISSRMNTFFDRRDPLTGLLSRHGFGHQMERAIARIRRFGRRLAVLWIDPLDLPEIERRDGQTTADDLRLRITTRLSELVRRVDTLARLDHDSFGVLKTDFEGTEHVAILARRLLEALEGENGLGTRARIGIAVYPPGEGDPAKLLREAELARHRCSPEVGSFAFYDEEISREVQYRLRLLEDLGRAIEDRQLRLDFQPQVDLNDCRVVAAEALLRWNHPELGEIPPAQIIALAAQNGLMPQIGRQVLDRACREAARWRHRDFPAVPVTVNLSHPELRDEDLVPALQETLERHGLEPSALELELSEEALGLGRDTADETLEELHRLGVRLALDDFGIGPSSLEELVRLPFHKIKIDQSFVQRLPEDVRALAVVRAALGLAQTLGLQAVAEGVETAAQLQVLLDEGCCEAQGYHVGRPQEADRLLRRLEEGHRQGQRRAALSTDSPDDPEHEASHVEAPIPRPV
jgi:diguanylate cyclase (GGDEF)-like protein